MYTYPYPWVNCLCILSLKTYLNSNYDDLAYEQKKRAIPGRIFLIAIYIPTVPSPERQNGTFRAVKTRPNGLCR